MANEQVIVVDDDPTNVGLIKMLLEMDGFHVHACTTIDQAIQASAADTSAFIIDCYLARGVSGLDLLTAVRDGNTNANQDTIILMTSGDQRLEDPTMAAGATAFFLKPYSPSNLSTELTKLLNTGAHNG